MTILNRQPDLIRFLNKLGKELNSNFSRINSGGCCVVAGMIGNYLETYVAVSVAVSDDEGEVESIDAVRDELYRNNMPNTVRSWNSLGLFFGHVILEFEYKGILYQFDTNGCVKARKTDPCFGYPLFPGRLTVVEAMDLGAQEQGWNWFFDRNQIPDMEQMVESHFAKFDKRWKKWQKGLSTI